MGIQKSLSLPYRFKFPHSSLSHPGWLMRLLDPIICILGSVVDGLRDELPAGNAIAAQFVSDDLPWLTILGS